MEVRIENINQDVNLVADIKQLITNARLKVATVANAGITMLYWHIGERINREVLGNQRAEYGKRIVSTVSAQLQQEYGGQEFSTRNLRRMMQFADYFPDPQIVSPLATQLSWTHFTEVLPIKDAIQREFYLTMAAEERWTKRTLRAKIDGMLFERTAISEKPEELIRTELAALRNERKISPDMVFKSPYFLEFTGLKALDLKLGRFKAQYKGQMELYLRWLERYEMQPGEGTPLGLILCTEGSNEQIELLQLDATGIKVAQYMTELPPKEVLIRQLQKTIEANHNLS